jgi:hypothetical protein
VEEDAKKGTSLNTHWIRKYGKVFPKFVGIDERRWVVLFIRFAVVNVGALLIYTSEAKETTRKVMEVIARPAVHARENYLVS